MDRFNIWLSTTLWCGALCVAILIGALQFVTVPGAWVSSETLKDAPDTPVTNTSLSQNAPVTLRHAARAALAALQPSSARRADRPGRRFFWTHIPKTGGTFVEQQIRTPLKNVYERNSFHSEEVPCSGVHQPLSELFRLAEQEPRLSDSTRKDLHRLFQRLSSVTEVWAVLRHPYERAVSQYSWGQRGIWKRLNYQDLNAFVQDSVQNATGPCTGMYPTRLGDSPDHWRVGGPFHQDCHWVPQVSYVFTEHRDKQIVHNLMWMGNLTDDLNARLRQYGVNTNSTDTRRRTPSKRKAVRLLELTEKTLNLLDEYYADDFVWFGFQKLRGEQLLRRDLLAPMKLIGGRLMF